MEMGSWPAKTQETEVGLKNQQIRVAVKVFEGAVIVDKNMGGGV